jgi:hypothetical protein
MECLALVIVGARIPVYIESAVELAKVVVPLFAFLGFPDHPDSGLELPEHIALASLVASIVRHGFIVTDGKIQAQHAKTTHRQKNTPPHRLELWTS